MSWNTSSYLSYLVSIAPYEGQRLGGIIGASTALESRKKAIENKIQGYSMACDEAVERHFSDMGEIVDVLNACNSTASALNDPLYNPLTSVIGKNPDAQYPWWLANGWAIYRTQNLKTNFYNEIVGDDVEIINENLRTPAHLPGYLTSSDVSPSDNWYYDDAGIHLSGSLTPIRSSLIALDDGVPKNNPTFTLSKEFRYAILTDEERTYINANSGDMSPSVTQLRGAAWDTGLGYWSIMAPFNGRVESIDIVTDVSNDILVIDPSYMNDPYFKTDNPQGWGLHTVTYSSGALVGAELLTEGYFETLLNTRRIKLFDAESESFSSYLGTVSSVTISGENVLIKIVGHTTQAYKDLIDSAENRVAFSVLHNDLTGVYDFTHGWSTVFSWNSFYKSLTSGDWRYIDISSVVGNFGEHVDLDGSNLFVNTKSFFEVDGDYQYGRDLMYHLNVDEDTLKCKSLSTAIYCQGIYSGMIREVANPKFGLMDEVASLDSAINMMELSSYPAINEEYLKKEQGQKQTDGYAIFDYVDSYTRIFRSSVSSMESQTPIGTEQDFPNFHGGIPVTLLTGFVETACSSESTVAQLSVEEDENNVDERLPYNMYLGFHADEDNGLETPRLVREIFEKRLGIVKPPANGAMAFWRHITDDNYELMKPQRRAAAELGFESPSIVMIPFTERDPGTNDPAQNTLILTRLAEKIELYRDENPIFGFANLNARNWMTDEPDTATRETAFFALEAQAIKVIQDAGFRWFSTDDQGLTFLVAKMEERRAAWDAEGVSVSQCQFHASHCYVDSGFVPVHLLLAEAALTRLGDGIDIPIRITELAYSFFGEGHDDISKPWMRTEYEIDNNAGPNGTDYPAHSLTWTRLLLEWFRTNQRHGLIFDWSMLVDFKKKKLSTWGEIFFNDQKLQPIFQEPPIGSLWFNKDKAKTRAYALRLANGGDPGDAENVATYVEAGHLFSTIYPL